MSYLSVVAASAPDHWWRLADPGGGLCHDIGSAPPLAMALTGSAAQLAYSGPSSDGGSIWIDSNASAWHIHSHPFTSPWSFEVWYWRHYFTAVQEALFEIANGTVTAGIELTTGNQVAGFSGAVPSVATAVSPTENAWHYAALSYGPAAGLKFYSDGILIGTVAYAGVVSANLNIGVGINPNGAGSKFAHANIAEAAFYAREISSTEQANHFAAGDLRTTRPVYRGIGLADLTTGGGVLSSADSADILKAVRRTFPTT